MNTDNASGRPIIVWFRRDLRLDDHPALTQAARSGRSIVPLVVLDPRLRRPGFGSRRVERFDSAVAALDRDLRARGGRLIVRTGEPTTIIPELAHDVGAEEVLAGRDLTPFARRRDAAVTAALAGLASLRLFPGELVVDPEATGEVRVFSPFYRRWQGAPRRPLLPPPPSIAVPDSAAGETVPRVLSDGGPEALDRLAAFQRERAAGYSANRDRLDLDGTSRLSIDLHLGTLSPLRAATTTSDAFVRQLAWRDWAHHLLWFAQPAAGEPGPAGDGRSGAPAGEPVWRDDPEAFAAWRDGRTGYPTVDAAMRELAATGWIHNRARLIVASFLTKDLLLDWRAGEAHFLATLADGDVANNRLGWRWTSGVGHDAAPFVRVLNPVLQGERFDPHGSWVRRWLPELADVPDSFVHRPWDAPSPPRSYPPRIVEHAAARARALAAFAGRPRP